MTYQTFQFTPLQNSTPLEWDKSEKYISRAKKDNYAHDILSTKIHNDVITGREVSALEYVKFGKLLASVLQEELAFHSFYMAHLKDPQTFKTNSDLQFDTYNTNILNE
jgi:hypothetical protein